MELHQRSRRLHETVIDLELTSGCCSNCVFCPRDKIRRQSSMISEDVVAELATHLSSRHVVWFSGMGEPLLHKSFVSIVKILRWSGCLVYTNTNGMAPLTEVKLGVAQPDFVNLSLYGLDRESFEKTTGQDGFDLVQARIQWLKTSGLRWRLSYVTEEQDPAKLTDIKARLQEMSGGNARILTKHSRAFGEEGQQVQPVCGLCEHYLFVACDGRILSCAHDVSAENAFSGTILWAAQAKRATYPFQNCSRCDSQGLKKKALEPGYFDKVRRLAKEEAK